MMSLSQKNLLELARKNEKTGNLSQAIENAEEALRIGSSKAATLQLCELYLKNGQADFAYSLIKEESDLFSNQEIFAEYSKILQTTHYVIEALEISNLSKNEIKILVEPVKQSKQQRIMVDFKEKRQPTLNDYQQLFKLDLNNFKQFSQSLLIDPSLNFAVRISICEDLIRLGLDDHFRVLVLGKIEEFVPRSVSLLEKDPIYREVVSGIGSRYYHRPNQLPTILAEVNLILGNLYPMINMYVDDPDSFTSDLVSYIENHDGRSRQKLFEAIELNLPK
ncbi:MULTISPECIES: tetratricopeptide repeat protein [unclassified Lactobacillus]|uniref:tetratricopeptide repeat protein n=1 Tax=unclassified Lactobacillus TaxID=2620435 RepID=UPI000EFD30BE|nr:MULTISPECIES: tetratricopeptide repeat protein [unclassified Lactobacillus]RMC25142.1 tetratricopeptide repeat protein [Lactobacillus sp. ESL0247]RMC29296.1 tetratricopeptide repeat protein [Lactobacillus sp. ESL0246]RMC32317.1 tetratricopeptide repeat protein [Lactobacillus sp. ESL0245]